MAKKLRSEVLVPPGWMYESDRGLLTKLFVDYPAFFAGWVALDGSMRDSHRWKMKAHSAFCDQKDSVPGRLAVALTEIIQVSTAEAQREFLAVAAKHDLDLGMSPEQLNPNNLALIFYLRFHDLFMEVYLQQRTSAGSAMDEFLDPSCKPITLKMMKKRIEAFKKLVADRRMALRCTRYLQLVMVEDEDRFIIYIARGAPALAVETINSTTLEVALVRLLPTHHDMLIIDKTDGRLSIKAQDKDDVRFYVESVGEAVHENKAQYQKGDTYTCDPLLRDGPASLKPFGDRMTAVRLKEVRLESRNPEEGLKVVLSQQDLIGRLPELTKSKPYAQLTRPTRMVLGVRFKHLKKEVEVIVCGNRITVMPSVREEVRDFLRARGFIVRAAANAARAA